MCSCICHHDCKGTLIGFFYVRRNDPYFGHGRYGGSHEVRVIFLDGSRLCYGGTHLCGVMHCWVRYTCPHSAAHRLCCLECSQGSGTCAEHHYARCVDPDCLRSEYFSAAWIFPNLSLKSASSSMRNAETTYASSFPARPVPAPTGGPAGKRRHPKTEQSHRPA